MPEQRLGILREAEEIILLLDRLGHRPVNRAAPVLEVLLEIEGLAAGAVETLVVALIDVPALVAALEQLLHPLHVPLVGGPDEGVVRDAKLRPDGRITDRQLIAQRLGIDPQRLGRLGHLLAVLIHAHLEMGVDAHEALEAGHGVGLHLLEGVAEMRIAAGVVDGGGQIVAGHGGSLVDRPPKSKWQAGL